MTEASSRMLRIVKEEEVLEDLSTGGRSGGRDVGGRLGGDRVDDKTAGKIVRSRFEVSVEAVKQEMTYFLQDIDEIFTQAEREKSGVSLEEVEVSIEISGEGKVALWGGTGVGIGGKGEIKLKFKVQ